MQIDQPPVSGIGRFPSTLSQMHRVYMRWVYSPSCGFNLHLIVMRLLRLEMQCPAREQLPSIHLFPSHPSKLYQRVDYQK